MEDRAPAAASTPAAHLAQGQRTAIGTFTGASGHATSGEAAVFLTSAGYVVSLGSDFSLDGAPDPHVSFGDSTTAAVNLAPLTKNDGAQLYAVPANVDVGLYRHVLIWCEEFAVPLGIAELELR